MYFCFYLSCLSRSLPFPFFLSFFYPSFLHSLILFPQAEQLEEKLRVISESVPTKICNTAGSTAGAGSGEFHTYRSQKRRDQIRQAKLEGDLKKEREQAAFDQRKESLAAAENEKTSKRRSKRNKFKEKRKAKREEMKAKKKASAGAGAGAGASNKNGDNDKSQVTETEALHPSTSTAKRRRVEDKGEEPPEVADLD